MWFIAIFEFNENYINKRKMIEWTIDDGLWILTCLPCHPHIHHHRIHIYIPFFTLRKIYDSLFTEEKNSIYFLSNFFFSFFLSLESKNWILVGLFLPLFFSCWNWIVDNRLLLGWLFGDFFWFSFSCPFDIDSHFFSFTMPWLS